MTQKFYKGAIHLVRLINPVPGLHDDNPFRHQIFHRWPLTEQSLNEWHDSPIRACFCLLPCSNFEVFNQEPAALVCKVFPLDWRFSFVRPLLRAKRALGGSCCLKKPVRSLGDPTQSWQQLLMSRNAMEPETVAWEHCAIMPFGVSNTGLKQHTSDGGGLYSKTGCS